MVQCLWCHQQRILPVLGYNDGRQFSITPSGRHDFVDRQRAQARARHETINGRFKFWNSMSCTWRHCRVKHGVAFRALANIIQLELETVSEAFQMEYNEAELWSLAREMMQRVCPRLIAYLFLFAWGDLVIGSSQCRHMRVFTGYQNVSCGTWRKNGIFAIAAIATYGVRLRFTATPCIKIEESERCCRKR